MKTFIFILLGISVLAGFAFAQDNALKSPGSKIVESMKFGEIALNIPEVGRDVERVVLDNGIIVYLYEDHSLPLFNIFTNIRCGAIYDPDDKDGLSEIVGRVMRTGGTKTISGDSLNILLEFIGGSLETSIGDEAGNASLSLLSKDIDLGLKLYADLLRNPAFPQDQIDLVKEEIKNRIKRRNDKPGDITRRYFYQILYESHPLGRVQEWATIKSITRDDLVNYHNRFFVPNNIMIGVAGDFNSLDIMAALKKFLGDWKKSDSPLPDYPAVSTVSHPGVYQIKKDINQANIRIGELGIKRDNPDRYAIDLMNYILGGGSFTSRLTSRVRSDEGLAYSVGSRYITDSRDFGSFFAYTQTKSSTAHKAVRLMLEEIKKIRNEGVTTAELEEARSATINQFIFNFDNSGEIIRNLMSLEYDGYPLDYYNHYLDFYRKITLDDIRRVANEYLKPENLTIILVGNPDLYEKPMDEFGPVTNIDLVNPIIE
ncbi:MAG: pitrilysin family protein [Candidatus Zixiibacteriota bacterium]